MNIDTKANVAYLNGDLAPQDLKALKVNGIGYNLSVLQKD